MLNIGLLDPRQVVERALAHALRRQVPMNSLEGFIHQVIGWREFMHGLYRHRGVALRSGNSWRFERPMPRSFYDGTTGVPPVDRVIRQLLGEGWCHHIERLMILGNFMPLCRIRPDDVYRWFMEMFVDAYDWVMVPNVYGMSQFADGGTFTTKPYLSGSNYVCNTMSDEPRGDWCGIWDALFWTFIADHRGFFLSKPATLDDGEDLGEDEPGDSGPAPRARCGVSRSPRDGLKAGPGGVNTGACRVQAGSAPGRRVGDSCPPTS